MLSQSTWPLLSSSVQLSAGLLQPKVTVRCLGPSSPSMHERPSLRNLRNFTHAFAHYRPSARPRAWGSDEIRNSRRVIYIYIHTHVVCGHIDICTHTHTYAHTLSHTHMYTYIYIYIHVHVCMSAPSSKNPLLGIPIRRIRISSPIQRKLGLLAQRLLH